MGVTNLWRLRKTGMSRRAESQLSSLMKVRQAQSLEQRWTRCFPSQRSAQLP